jgi:hypothetical protein
MAKLSIYLQQSANLTKLVKASSIVGLFLSAIQLIVQAILV